MDYSPPGSSVHGILQARILEWVAISFSNNVYNNKHYYIYLYIDLCIKKWVVQHVRSGFLYRLENPK